MLRTRMIGLRTSTLAPILLCIFTASCRTVQTRELSTEESLADFNSDKASDADAAYHELYAAGVDAIPLLLQNAERTAPFSGNAYQNPLSSILPLEAPSQGLISLYLVEAIRAGFQYPHQTAALTPAMGTSVLPPDPTRRALEAYRAWWRKLNAKSIDDVRRAPDPLEGTGLAWRGPPSY